MFWLYLINVLEMKSLIGKYNNSVTLNSLELRVFLVLVIPLGILNNILNSATHFHFSVFFQCDHVEIQKGESENGVALISAICGLQGTFLFQLNCSIYIHFHSRTASLLEEGISSAPLYKYALTIAFQFLPLLYLALCPTRNRSLRREVVCWLKERIAVVLVIPLGFSWRWAGEHSFLLSYKMSLNEGQIQQCCQFYRLCFEKYLVRRALSLQVSRQGIVLATKQCSGWIFSPEWKQMDLSSSVSENTFPFRIFCKTLAKWGLISLLSGTYCPAKDS